MNKTYNEPFFKVVNVNSEDVITTSETVFGILNGFEIPSVTPAKPEEDWSMFEFEL